MHIAVINGSPKGRYSITYQTVRYLERIFPEHTFEVLHAGQTIRALERDLSPARELLSRADAVLFSYPVYTFLAPSQLHRFLELVRENGLDLSGKVATQITTSKHFYDVTAHRYVKDCVRELGMRYVEGLSADMEDLLTERGRDEARMFFERFLFSVAEGLVEEPSAPAAPHLSRPVHLPASVGDKAPRDVVIVADLTDTDGPLARMIERFRAVLPYTTRVVNIREYPFSGGCLGCFKCAVSERCVYKDGFDTFLRESIQAAEATVYAFTVSDHSMGARFKMFDDRQFCNGHRTVTVGMPVGYLVSGPYEREENLRTVIEARADTGGNVLCGVATDERDPDRAVDELAKMLSFALETHHRAPQRFYGVGGMKIFRDLIYEMRGMMRADHRFYKKRGIYDFPQKRWARSMRMYLVGWLLGNERLLARMGNKMNDGMLLPYEKLFAKMDGARKR